jgi:hypothetical protein
VQERKPLPDRGRKPIRVHERQAIGLSHAVTVRLGQMPRQLT